VFSFCIYVPYQDQGPFRTIGYRDNGCVIHFSGFLLYTDSGVYLTLGIFHMNTLHELQHWYLAQCNEDWEHTYGVSIGTLDNPGWSITIELTDTQLENKPFPAHSYGIKEEAETSGDNWLICKVEDRKFIGYGGPMKLQEILDTFLSWAKQHA